MRRAFLALALVAVSSAGAQAITRTVTNVGSYTVPFGTTHTVVDVYRVTLDAGAPHLLGAVWYEVGTMVGQGGADPFQAGHKHTDPSDPGTETIALTPTQETATTWLGADPTLHAADSHVLWLGISTWTSPVLYYPEETNDGSFQDVLGDYYLGVGGLRVAITIPPERRVQVADVVQVGVIHGTTVWIKDYSADNLGQMFSPEEREFMIPEPGTMLLFAGGAWVVLRRRAGRR